MKEANAINENVISPEFAFLAGSKSLILNTSDSSGITNNLDAQAKIISKKGVNFRYIPWGANDDLPNQVAKKVYDEPTTGTGVEFNITLGYGDGVMPVKRTVENNQLKFVPYFDNAEINAFLEDNDVNGTMYEQFTDIKHFYNAYPELVLSRNQDNRKRKIVELNHKEAMFSRLSEMNANGVIEKHIFNSTFGTTRSYYEKDIAITSLLDPDRPLLDLKRKMGLAPRLNGKYLDEKEYRYIVPTWLPTPGKWYYQQPYWWSIFTSGWYDFLVTIPRFKKALLDNQATIKYIVYIDAQYWVELFQAEGKKNKKDQEARKKEEYENIDNFLSGTENTGKSITATIGWVGDKERKYIQIVPVENAFKGGEYIEDGETAINIISYTLGVHPQVIGASPGKNGSINGTEARELFTIKQALMKPIRDRVLRPLTIIKAINQWPADVFFTIPNIQLTTLDKNTGAQKVISQAAL